MIEERPVKRLPARMPDLGVTEEKLEAFIGARPTLRYSFSEPRPARKPIATTFDRVHVYTEYVRESTSGALGEELQFGMRYLREVRYWIVFIRQGSVVGTLARKKKRSDGKWKDEASGEYIPDEGQDIWPGMTDDLAVYYRQPAVKCRSVANWDLPECSDPCKRTSCERSP